MTKGHIGINVHHTTKLSVEARDIDYFWTVRLDATDEAGGQFAVDLYVNDFHPTVMESFAEELEAGAESIRLLAAKKNPKPKKCLHEAMTTRWDKVQEDGTRDTTTTCDDCGEEFDGLLRARKSD